MATTVTDFASGGLPAFVGEYTVDPGGYDWVIDFERYNKNTKSIGFFIDNGTSWTQLYDTSVDEIFPNQNSFNHASFTIGNAFTFNGVYYGGDAFIFDNPQDKFVFFVVPTITPQPGSQFSWSFNVSITPHAAGPQAVNDKIVYADGQKGSISFDIVANDTDPQNDLNRNSIQVTQAPKHGTIAFDNGVVTYTPNAPFSELPANRPPHSDSFTYTIKDATGIISNPATVRIKADDCPEPLPMIVTGGTHHEVSPEMCRVDGTFFVGRDDGDANLIEVRNGSAEIYDTHILVHGDIYSGTGGRLLIPGATVDLIAPVAKSDKGTFHAGAHIQLAGLDFEQTSLGLEPNAVVLGGKLQLSEAFDTIKLDLDDLGVPLRIESGNVAGSSAQTLPYNFAHFAKEWQAQVEKMSFSYNAATDALRLNGIFTLKTALFGGAEHKFNTGVKLDLSSGGNFLEIKEGKVSGSASGSIEAPLKFGELFEISKVTAAMAYSDDAIQSVSLGGEVSIKAFAGGATIGGKVGAIRIGDAETGNLKWDSFELTVAAGDTDPPPGVGDPLLQYTKAIPIFTGGPVPVLFLVGGGVSATGIAALLGDGPTPPEAQLDLHGELNFALGAPVKINLNLADYPELHPLATLLGTPQINDYFLSLKATGDLKFAVGSAASDEVVGSLTLQALSDKIFSASGEAAINLTKGTLSATLQAHLLNDTVSGNLKVTLDSRGVHFDSMLNGHLPSPDGSFNIVDTSIRAYGNFVPDDNPNNDFILLLQKVHVAGISGDLAAGVRIWLDPRHNGSPIDFIPPGQAENLVGSWDTRPGMSGLVMNARWTEEQSAPVAVKVTFRPVGGALEEYNQAEFAAHGITIVDALTGPFGTTVVVANPAVGRWDIVPLDAGPLGDLTYHGYSPDADPTIAIPLTTAADGVTTHFNVNYENGDVPYGVNFYWDTDGDGVGGTLFANLPELASGGYGVGLGKPADAPAQFWIYGNADSDGHQVMAPVETPLEREIEVTIDTGSPTPVNVDFYWDTDGDGVGGALYVTSGPWQPGSTTTMIGVPGGVDLPATFWIYGQIEGTGTQVLAPQWVALTYDVAFTIPAGNAASNVDLYWDADGDGLDGTLFQNYIGVQPGAQSFAFDTPAGAPENFWVYAQTPDANVT